MSNLRYTIGSIYINPPSSPDVEHAQCFHVCVGSIPRGNRGNILCPVPSCQQTRKSYKQLHTHVHLDHPICRLCDPGADVLPTARWLDQTTLDTHMETHRVCIYEDCQKRCKSVDRLLVHYQQSHPSQCCLECHRIPFPVSSYHVLCGDCAPKAFSRAPTLLEIPEEHEVFRNVSMQFQRGWLHSDVPLVAKIWKIYGHKEYVYKYMEYKQKVIQSSGYADGNAQRRWHGTTRTCRLGDSVNSTKILCRDSKCSLCRIIETNFDLQKFGENTGWGRFGRGIYTSATSSKADSYSRNRRGSKGSIYKIMLLNAVILGRSKILTENNEELEQPPSGYESVTGIPGYNLNYDECVVYDCDAIRPMYLVVYTCL